MRGPGLPPPDNVDMGVVIREGGYIKLALRPPDPFMAYGKGFPPAVKFCYYCNSTWGLAWWHRLFRGHSPSRGQSLPMGEATQFKSMLPDSGVAITGTEPLTGEAVPDKPPPGIPKPGKKGF